ncbi:hypothetical protein BH11PSE6_BH11PSE6_08000 [soil metagenome]
MAGRQGKRASSGHLLEKRRDRHGKDQQGKRDEEAAWPGYEAALAPRQGEDIIVPIDLVWCGALSHARILNGRRARSNRDCYACHGRPRKSGHHGERHIEPGDTVFLSPLSGALPRAQGRCIKADETGQREEYERDGHGHDPESSVLSRYEPPGDQRRYEKHYPRSPSHFPVPSPSAGTPLPAVVAYEHVSIAQMIGGVGRS